MRFEDCQPETVLDLKEINGCKDKHYDMVTKKGKKIKVPGNLPPMVPNDRGRRSRKRVSDHKKGCPT